MAVVAFLGAAAPALAVSFFVGLVIGVAVYVVFGRDASVWGRWGMTLGLGLLASLAIFGALALALAQAYTTISYGTVGLVVRFGGLTGQVFDPGLHWRTPFIDQLVTVPTIVQSYETSDNPTESGSNFTDVPVTAQTIDGQQINIKYTVLFRIPEDRSVRIMENVGYMNDVVQNIVKAYSRNLARLWAQNYTAADLYSGEGIFDYESEVRKALTTEFQDFGLVLDDFLVRKVDFSADYVNAIEEKQIAQEAIDTAKYRSNAAEYEKERQIRLAEAEAARLELLADAEAYSIKVRGSALAEFPSLVRWEFVRNLQEVRWGILPSEGIAPLIPMPSFEPSGEGSGDLLDELLVPEAIPVPTAPPEGEGEPTPAP